MLAADQIAAAVPPLPMPFSSIASDAECKPRAERMGTVARIDGWGPRAWREALSYTHLTLPTIYSV